MLTPTRVRQVLVALVIIFVVYAVIVSPTEAANVVRTAITKLGTGLGSVGEFFDALMAKKN